MLFGTSLLSYFIYKSLRELRRKGTDEKSQRDRLREYYFAQRDHAREMIREFDLTDEEIEQRVERELRK